MTFRLRTLFIVMVIIGLALCAVIAGRRAANRQKNRDNLWQIAIALRNYHDVYNSFPPAYIADSRGKPRTSWRAMLLNFIENTEWPYYDFDASWDAAANAEFRSMRQSVYQSPLSDDVGTNRTSYVVVTSKSQSPAHTIFVGTESARLPDIKDGESETIAVVEIQNSDIEWCEPRDIDIDSISTRPGSPNWVDLEGGAVVATADGGLKVLPPGTSLQVFKKLLTRDGGEMLDL